MQFSDRQLGYIARRGVVSEGGFKLVGPDWAWPCLNSVVAAMPHTGSPKRTRGGLFVRSWARQPEVATYLRGLGLAGGWLEGRPQVDAGLARSAEFWLGVLLTNSKHGSLEEGVRLASSPEVLEQFAEFVRGLVPSWKGASFLVRARPVCLVQRSKAAEFLFELDKVTGGGYLGSGKAVEGKITES